MLRIIIALIVFAIADDACAGRLVTRPHVSKRALNVLSGHRIVKILHPRTQRKQNID